MFDYVLIVFILVGGYYPTSTNTSGFTSQACETAGKKAISDLANPDPGFAKNSIKVSYSCVKRG